MSPATAVKTCLRKYVDFSGRASRSEFWWFVLFYVLAGAVAFGVDAAARTPGIIYLVVVLGLVLPGLSAEFRRLHDTGRSGWWILISLVPLIGSIWLLVLLASSGHATANRYGEPPTSSH